MSIHDRDVNGIHDHTGVGHSTGIYGINPNIPRQSFVERHRLLIVRSIGLAAIAAITAAALISSGALK